MEISYTGYTTFLSNWEKFRLYKGLGLVPQVPSVPLQRGLALHLLAEKHFNDAVNLQERLEQEGITQEGLQAAEFLWPALKEYLEIRPGKILGNEVEFKVPLEGTEHFMVGRLDTALAGYFEQNIVEEYKSAGPRKKMWEIEKEWKCSVQANFTLIGASHLFGEEFRAINIVTIQEGTPPNILPLLVTRSDYDLEYQKRSCAQVCDVIEFLISKYGLEKPWPHFIPSQWACDIKGSCNNGWCEYRDICGQELAFDEVPEGFKQRPEDETLKHLKRD